MCAFLRWATGPGASSSSSSSPSPSSPSSAAAPSTRRCGAPPRTWRPLLLTTVACALTARAELQGLEEVDQNARRLATITNLLNNQSTALGMSFLTESPFTCRPGECLTPVTGMYAGEPFTRIEVTVTPDKFGLAPSRFRIVRDTVDTTLAQAGACLPGDFTYGTGLATVNNPWATTGSLTTLASQDEAMRAASELTFKQGGIFRLCYSHDGTFSPSMADIVPPMLAVYGVYDKRLACAEDITCLTERPYRCYLQKLGFNNMDDAYDSVSTCVLDFSGTDQGYEGPPGLATWSAKFSATYRDNGDVRNYYPETCGQIGQAPEPFLCRTGQGDCDTGDYWIQPKAAAANEQVELPSGLYNLDETSTPRYGAYSVAACYCPQKGACDEYTDFIQQIGILHFYATKVCANGFASFNCGEDYMGATPQHRFSLRVECPTNACSANSNNRLKVVAQAANNGLPAWDASNGCGAAVHGRNAGGKLVLLPDDNLDMDTVSGGARQDFKIWNFKNSFDINTDSQLETGFLFRMGTTDHELRSFHNGETFDLCYCDSNCEDGDPLVDALAGNSNWFKVGQLRLASFQLVSAISNITSRQDEFTITYINQPGTLGLYRPPTDYYVMGLMETERPFVKFVADPDLSIDDAGCRAASFDPLLDPQLVEPGVPTSTFRGVTNVTTDRNKLMFNRGAAANQFSVQRAGVVAICYCSSQNQMGGCEQIDGVEQWVLAMRLTIRGPTLGQSWTYSTHVTFRLEYTGFGLSSDDVIRIIPADGDCTENTQDGGGGPNGAYTVTYVKLSCPHPCSEVGDVTDVMNGNIAVKVLADDAYGCDSKNSVCRSNDIKGAMVIDDSTTELEFESDHTMSDGDMISLSDNIVCADDQPPFQCTDEMLSSLKGVYNFSDREDNYQYAPKEYFAGHRVTTTSDPKKLRIPVGWPEPRPEFAAAYVQNKRGKWTRHNKAITSEEIMGGRERLGMKVCWAYLGTPDRDPRPSMRPKHTAEMGTISLMEPNAMSGPLAGPIVSLTTLVKRQNGPLIISFDTAAGATGQRYTQVQGATRLRIFFVRTLALRATFGDGGALEVNPGEDERVEARQYICGKIFKELWSSDNDRGFPMPTGCYYTSYGYTQEINVLFDRKNGLAEGKQYQMVMSGVATDQASVLGEYVHILAMDDMDTLPYTAIERGVAKLAHQPMDGAYGGDSVKWYRPDGVKVIGGGDADLMQLEQGSSIQLQMKGDPLGGGIKAGSIIRIFLWPLTMWNVETRCTATCIPYDQVAAPCGAVQDCVGDTIVTNANKNFLRVVMPATMTTMTQFISHTLVIAGLRMPERGFFATRFGFEVRKADDTKPDYITSVGDFFWKIPNNGTTVAKIIDYYGDGDFRPFRSDTRNVLYTTLVLSATLFSSVQTGDAMLTLTLPEGYSCVRTQDIDGESPWRAEGDLGVFGDQIPQGIGTPDEGSGTRGWTVDGNKCFYSLRQNAVLYAGTALTVRLTVNNPVVAMKRGDDANRWQVQMTSKGYHQYTQSFPPVFFATDNDERYDERYCSNKAVLGVMTDAKMVPSNFGISSDSSDAMNWLRIFFRAEQSTGVLSKMIVKVPGNYTMPTMCSTRNLPSMYYVTHPGILQQRTRRLPGVISCEFRLMPFRHVRIELTGSVLGGEYYAFEVETRNPNVYDSTTRQGWSLMTRSAADFGSSAPGVQDGREGDDVDGTQNDTIGMAMIDSANPDLLDGTAFGLYQYPLNTPEAQPIKVHISNMLPYSITGERAQVNVSLRVPVDVSTAFRIVAPSGFEWDFETNEFLYQSVDLPTVGTFMATAALPGGAPEKDGNVLLSASANPWLASRRYAFSTYIRVPDRTPTWSLNEFLVEFGHSSEDFAARLGAESVPAGPVRRLVSAKIDFSNPVESKVNDVVFQIETITEIPYMGVLKITGPPGFRFEENCMPEAAAAERGSPYEILAEADRNMFLPANITCYAISSGNVTGDPVQIHIVAGQGGIMPGRYRFQLSGTNPSAIVANPMTGAAPCGYALCWTFESLANYNDANSPHLDAPTAAPGFRTTRKIVEALIPAITDLQKALTGRDDRPFRYNPLLFAIKINNQQLFPEDLVIRGPAGSIFREDCLQDVELRGTEVFGSNQPLPDDYTAWPAGVLVTSCRGEGPNARLRVDPGATQGLQPEMRYPFRVALLHNPIVTPTPNTWTISYGDEGSDPWEPQGGGDLWTFTRTSVHTVSIGASTSVTGAPFLENPVTFTFMPYNTVRGKDMEIRVTAPVNFQIAHTARVCRVMIQPISADASGFAGAGNNTPPHPNYIGPPSLVWGEAIVECTVDQATQRTMTARLLTSEGDRELTAGRDYQITIFVKNSVFPMPEGPLNQWVLETYNSPADSGALPLFRDMVTIPGYAVVDQVRTWFYRNGMAGQPPQRNGVTPVTGLYFEMKFPTKLEIGNVVELQGPAGFEFTEVPGLPGVCQGFTWEPPEDAPLFLPQSPRVCNGSKMTFTVQERRFLPEMRDIKFRIDTINPAKTPHVMLNHWSCTHYNGDDAIVSTRAVLGWDIVPQLYNVRVLLVGARRAAGSMSASLAISFMPVSDADMLEFEATLPQGFDFTGVAATSVGHEVVQTIVERVRIRASMFADVQTDIVLEGLRLGDLGGATLFKLVTKLNNGEQMDESQSFTGGFRLPGALSVLEPRLTSMYTLSPDNNPVTALWDVRMGEPAEADFPFTITVMGNIGNYLRLRAPPYILNSQGFRVVKLPQRTLISSEVVSASSGELVARLGEELFVTNTYEVRVSVETPNRASLADTWSLEVLDGEMLSLDTNDGLTQGFRLVEQLGLRVQVTRSPPLAIVQAEVIIDPKTTRPTEFIIVAPPGFNFTENCLVRSGDNNEIIACAQAADVGGHAAARLTTKAGGLDRRTEFVIIEITSPASTPMDRNWFVDGRDSDGLQVGWGEDPIGVEVRQMIGAGVVYPGIPHISGQMAFRFITNEKIDSNGIIRVGYPRSIVVECNGAFFSPVAIEGSVECRNFPQLGYFELEMARPLPPGQQAFAVTSTAPDSVAESNSFFVVVRNPLGQVVDAAMDVPGYPIIHGLKVTALDLIWSPANPGSQNVVSLGFELLEELPAQGPPVISEIVVTIPRDFAQNVRRISHIESLGDPMPYRSSRSGGYLINSDPRQITLLLDESKTSVLPVGRYRFSFPVTVPARMPKYNVFTITLCGPNTAGSNSTCTGQNDPRALVTFPMTGFAMYSEHPANKQYMAIAGGRRGAIGLAPVLVAAALVLHLLASAADGPAR